MRIAQTGPPSICDFTCARYPAGHVHIHHIIYLLTNSGTDLNTAQQIYAALYLALLALTVGIYARAGGVPNWVLLLLPLSKRLHSIFVLRLFNDCWMVVFAHAAVLAYAHAFDLLGTVLLGYVPALASVVPL